MINMLFNRHTHVQWSIYTGRVVPYYNNKQQFINLKKERNSSKMSCERKK